MRSSVVSLCASKSKKKTKQKKRGSCYGLCGNDNQLSYVTILFHGEIWSIKGWGFFFPFSKRRFIVNVHEVSICGGVYGLPYQCCAHSVLF